MGLRKPAVVMLWVASMVGSVVGAEAAGAAVVQPTVTTLSASSPVLGSGGGTLVLSATVANGTACTFISHRPVDGLTSGPCTSGLVSDSVTVPPNVDKESKTYTFKLKVLGARSAVTTQVLVAVAGAGPHGLAWTSPPSITLGVPFTLSSLHRCPTAMPDGSAIVGTLYATASIEFPFTTTGSAVPARPDGSWSLPMTLNGKYSAGSFTITAWCVVQPSGLVLATYATHSIALSLPG